MDALPSESLRCDLAAELLRSHGGLQLRVTGSSMLPSLWPGDVLAIEAGGFARIQRGDIVLFFRDGRLFVHRVRQQSMQDGLPVLVTRGDAMPRNDPEVGQDEFLGRIATIHRRGLCLTTPRMGCYAMLGRILAHSDFCRRVFLRWHAWRTAAQLPNEFAVSEKCS